MTGAGPAEAAPGACAVRDRAFPAIASRRCGKLSQNICLAALARQLVINPIRRIPQAGNHLTTTRGIVADNSPFAPQKRETNGDEKWLVVEAVTYPPVSGKFSGKYRENSRKERKIAPYNRFSSVISGIFGLSAGFENREFRHSYQGMPEEYQGAYPFIIGIGLGGVVMWRRHRFSRQNGQGALA